MSKLKRGITTAQLQLRELKLSISGTLATPAAGSLDGKQILSVIDNGVGDYTIVLKRPFRKANAANCFAQITSITADRLFSVSAVDYDRVTVLATDLAGAPADADFFLQISGLDSRITY